VPRLLSVRLREDARPREGGDQPQGGFPFTVPAVRTLEPLDLSAPVTFFVGENGSGKSTLLEAIAAAADLPSLGGEELWDDATLEAQRRLARCLRLVWSRRTRQGFFLRAEDFFGFAKRQARTDARLAREMGPDVPDPVGADEAASARYIARYDSRSHGESFLDTFRRRVSEDGLYLLDEPESPLSPHRQLTLLALIAEEARAGSQFVIATHSPILLALPGARIYTFDELPVRETRYGELEHVTLTRDFLAAPQRYLRHLLHDPDDAPGDAPGDA